MWPKFYSKVLILLPTLFQKHCSKKLQHIFRQFIRIKSIVLGCSSGFMDVCNGKQQLFNFISSYFGSVFYKAQDSRIVITKLLAPYLLNLMLRNYMYIRVATSLGNTIRNHRTRVVFLAATDFQHIKACRQVHIFKLCSKVRSFKSWT